MADPDPNNEVTGKADIDGVAILLRGARLPERRRAQRCAPTSAVVGGGI